jgi:hypothetical protein
MTTEEAATPESWPRMRDAPASVHSPGVQTGRLRNSSPEDLCEDRRSPDNKKAATGAAAFMSLN